MVSTKRGFKTRMLSADQKGSEGALQQENWEPRNFVLKVEQAEVAKSTAAFQNALRKNSDQSTDECVLSGFPPQDTSWSEIWSRAV